MLDLQMFTLEYDILLCLLNTNTYLKTNFIMYSKKFFFIVFFVLLLSVKTHNVQILKHLHVF